MLTKKQQRRYLTEKERQWLRELMVYDESRSEDALHRLRLGIKKIRALVELAKVRSGKRAADHFRGLKKMFREAGVIRDTGSQVRFLEERHLLSPEHKDRQARSIKEAEDAFSAQIRQFRKKGKKASKRLKTDMQAIDVGRVLRWYAHQVIRTGVLLGSTGNELHEARKKIKTMLYVQKVLPPAISQRVKLNTEYLDHLQEAIGQWHDAVVAIGLWVEDNVAGKEAIRQECAAKEQVVKTLAEEFHLRVHMI